MNKKLPCDNKTAIVIIRISSGRQTDGLSLSVQQDEIELYCSRVGLNVVKQFSIVESAKDSSKRFKYKDAIDFAEKNKIGNVVFYMTDRESRNLTDLEANEDKIRRGVFNLHFAKDNSVVHKDSPDSEFLTRNFNGIINKQYSRNLSTKVNDGMIKKAESGWFPSNTPPLGYICQKAVDPLTGRIKNRGGIIVKDPNEVNCKIVLREFQLRSEGCSLESIRETIINEGLIESRKLRNYHVSVIANRLKNPFYSGSFIWQGITYKGNHEVFIPRQLLERVNISNGTRGSILRRDSDEFNVFAGGWLRCSCGAAVVYDPKKRIYKNSKEQVFHYYHCSNGKKVHESMKGMNISNDKIWKQLSKAIEDITISEEFAAEIADALNQLEGKAHSTTRSQIELLKREEAGFQEREDRLFNLFLDGNVDKDIFEVQRSRIRKDRDQIINQLEILQMSLNSAVIETSKSIIELAKSAQLLWFSQSPIERKKLIDRILSNPVLNGSNIEFNLRKPFEILHEMKGNTKWRTRQDSNLRPTD